VKEDTLENDGNYILVSALFGRNNSQLVDMSFHSDTSFQFRAKQSLLILLNAACLPEKQVLYFFDIAGETQYKYYHWETGQIKLTKGLLFYLFLKLV
jgi:hypothetical protein